MALISCPECQNSVSDSAFKCPNCGVLLRKPKRSFMGKLFKWSFIGFNILMAFWFFAGMSNATKGIENLNGAEQAGAAIGTGLGAFIILTLWVIGSVILGLFVMFTRPKAA